MKRLKTKYLFVVFALILPVFINCSQVTGGLSDQNPVLIAKIEIVNDPGNIIQIDKDHKAYLIYYNESDWSTPWLTHGAGGATIINPVVSTFSTYVAAFWDHRAAVGPDVVTDGNGVLDPGEPCTGFKSAEHTLTTITPLTKITFIPLEWRTITITLDPTVTYQNSFTVTINQASIQPDPATSTSIVFAVKFSTAINPATFTAADITDSGLPPGVATWTITDIGDQINFALTATVPAPGTPGTVQPSIAAGLVQNADLNGLNLPSTSTDNSVAYP